MVNWSFFRGKGPADGIGVAVTRTADSFVLTGKNITNPRSMIEALKDLP